MFTCQASIRCVNKLVSLHGTTVSAKFNWCATGISFGINLPSSWSYMLMCVREIRGSHGADVLCVSVCNSPQEHDLLLFRS